MQSFELRNKTKELTLAALAKHPYRRINGKGVKQAEVFRLWGFDWGDYPGAPGTQQQYWAVALLRELKSKVTVEKVEKNGPWRSK